MCFSSRSTEVSASLPAEERDAVRGMEELSWQRPSASSSHSLRPGGHWPGLSLEERRQSACLQESLGAERSGEAEELPGEPPPRRSQRFLTCLGQRPFDSCFPPSPGPPHISPGYVPKYPHTQKIIFYLYGSLLAQLSNGCNSANLLGRP